MWRSCKIHAPRRFDNILKTDVCLLAVRRNTFTYSIYGYSRFDTYNRILQNVNISKRDAKTVGFISKNRNRQTTNPTHGDSAVIT